jgi:transposase
MRYELTDREWAAICYNRFVRWRRAGVWSQVMEALAGAHDGDVQMIDTSIVRVIQWGSGAPLHVGVRTDFYPMILR